MSDDCDIYYFSDMQKCMKCGSSWDANDPHPPRCNSKDPRKVSTGDKVIAFLFGERQKKP